MARKRPHRRAARPADDPAAVERAARACAAAHLDPQCLRALGEYRGVAVRGVAESVVTDEDVQAAIHSAQLARRTWRPVTRGAMNGDLVLFDAVLRDPVSEALLEERLDEEQIIDADRPMIIDEVLLGAAAGETVARALRPATGRPVSVTLTVHSVDEPVVPGVDEVAREEWGTEATGLAEVVRAQLRATNEDRQEQLIARRVLRAVIKSSRVRPPAAPARTALDLAPVEVVVLDAIVALESLTPDGDAGRMEALALLAAHARPE